VAATTTKRELYWANWQAYVKPLGVDPFLQNITHPHKVRTLTGFAGQVRTGYYGQGRQVTAPTVTSALTAIATTISLACGSNPTKMTGAQDKMIPCLTQLLAGFKHTDPPMIKKLPVEIDIPEYIALCSLRPSATEHNCAVADLILIAFYYLLQMGEYTIKGSRNSTKCTVRFHLQDITFFKKDGCGNKLQLPQTENISNYLTADSATLKLDNQKNGWKGVCIHQECNGEEYH